jgi:hypothetical protein
MWPIWAHSESSDVTRNAGCFDRLRLGAELRSGKAIAAGSCIIAAFGTPVALPFCDLNWFAAVKFASRSRAMRAVSLVKYQSIETA